MNKTTPVLITLTIAFLAIAAPIVVVIQLAERQAMDMAQSLTIGYATDTLRRSEDSTGSFQQILETLPRVVDENPCSELNLELLDWAALGSSKIQAMGFVVDNRLICSTFGRFDEGFDLGPVDYVTGAAPEIRVRAGVSFPLIAGVEFLVLEKEGFVGFIHESVPLGATTNENGTLLATFNVTHLTFLARNSEINPSWLQDVPAAGEPVVFVRDGYVIAIVSSTAYDIASLAAIPVGHMENRVEELLYYLVPMGIIASLVLGFAIFYLSRQQLALPQAIKAGLQRDEFFVVYQPVLDLTTGRWVGAEALMRWRRPTGELVSPEIFMSVAEEAGLTGHVTRCLVAHLAHDLKDMFRDYPDLHVSLNLAANDFDNQDLIPQLRALMVETGAGRNNLSIEVTERSLTRPDPAKEVIVKLRKMGVTVAVDDFGIGYSSLSYLEQFELDVLKIDKFFVETIGVGDETPSAKVILHIIEMAKSLNLKMIAEGVETEHERDFLRDHDVRYAQGWLFSQPLRIDELIELLIAQGDDETEESLLADEAD